MQTVLTAMVNMLSQTNQLVGLLINQCTGIYTRRGKSFEILIVYLIIETVRVIFWNAKGYGWSIGREEDLVTGSHWHKSGLDSDEPWQGEWGKNVTVDCIKGVVKEMEINTMVYDIDDDNVSGNGVIDFKQSFVLEYFPLLYLIQYVRNIEAL